MPRKVTAYACVFKCGHRVTTKKKDMERHEELYCYKNPKTQACPTCKHDVDGDEDYKSFWCELELRKEDVNLIYNCKSWEAR